MRAKKTSARDPNPSGTFQVPEDQPTDLLSARAGAYKPSGFFDKPGVRKFVRNRSGMISLAVIAVFILIGALVAIPPHMITLDMVLSRVGPGSLPGFGFTPEFDKRIDVTDFYLSGIEKALDSSDPEAAIAAINYAGKHVVSLPLDEIQTRLDDAFASFDAFDEAYSTYDDRQIEYEDLLDAQPRDDAAIAQARVQSEHARAAAVAALEPVEQQVASLYETPTGWEGIFNRLTLLAGTDRQGLSISLRAIYSIKTAVQIGMVTAILSVLVGAVLGGAAGFFGGIVDHAVVWLYSTLSSIPYIIWLIVIAFVFRESSFKVPFTDKLIGQTLFPVYIAFGVTLWVGTCRVIRGEAMKIKSLDYIQAATSIGCSSPRILLQHVLPNVMYLMFINFSLAFVAAIKGEVILSYLGLGVQGQPSWGVMIRDSKDDVALGIFWELGAAMVLMFILVYAFNVFSDALQDAFDPKYVG